MITQGQTEKVRASLRSLSWESVVITAKAGTPLDCLTLAIGTIHEPDGDEDEAGNEKALCEASNCGDHDLELTETAAWVTRKISASINYARNTINPLVTDVVEACEDILELRNDTWESTHEIIPFKLSEIYFHPIFNVLLDGTTNTRATGHASVPATIVSHLEKTYSEEEIMKSLLTGDESFDTLVRDVNQHEWLMNLSGSRNMTSNSGMLSPIELNRLLFRFLILVAMRSGKLEGFSTRGLSNAENLGLGKAVTSMGHQLKAQLTRYQAMIESDTHFIASVEYRRIYVNERSYGKWLKAGGSADSILGFLDKQGLNDRDRVNLVNTGTWKAYSELLYKSLSEPGGCPFAKYLLRKHRTTQTVNAGKTCKNVDKAIHGMVLEFIRNHYAEGTDPRTTLVTKANAALEHGGYRASYDIELYVLGKVCKILSVDQNDAYAILLSIREYMQANKEATVQDAAIVATLNLYYNWAVSQLECTVVRNDNELY